MNRAELMPVIQNTSQQVVSRAMNPEPAYSRIVSCVEFVPTGPGAVYSFTPVLGQIVRLLEVRIWFAPHAVNMANQTLFRILTGTSQPNTAAEIRLWESVLPLVSPGFTDEPWTAYDGRDSMCWSMNRLYTGQGRRFGFWAERGPVGTDEISASFEISEG